ncbi:MAG TPA: iron-sulfur cluster assembly accessory protein [Candidatus Nanoarchaeia archaeon]|nr:iron-sulfur cluster assembly accessory protein [Candidatus Nanoarchaeia archaeon]
MITKDMTIGELVQQYPSVVEILMDEGVSCVGCGAAYFETIEEGLASHGRSEEEVTAIVEKLNQAIPHESGDENLTITENAAAKAKELLTKKNNQAIRIGVSSGGCAGFEYHFSFENDKSENDVVVEVDGVKFFVDNASLEKLKGAKVDYVDSLTSAGFKITNPNAKKTCGCGQSFA